jgi:hypothetical protein
MVSIGQRENSVVSYINYVCSSNDLCDQIFVKRWVRQLANIKHASLENELIHLLASDAFLGKCYVTDKLVECSTGMCIAAYNAILDNNTLKTGCIDNASMIRSLLYVKIQSVECQPMQYEELIYTCMSDECNSQSTFIHVLEQTANLLYFFEPIPDWLRSEIKFKELLNHWLDKLKKKRKDLSTINATKNNDYWSTTEIWSGCICIILIIMVCICCCA